MPMTLVDVPDEAKTTHSILTELSHSAYVSISYLCMGQNILSGCHMHNNVLFQGTYFIAPNYVYCKILIGLTR